MLNILLMKKWQKIAGIITLVVLAVLNIILCVYYLEYATSMYFEPGGSTQDAIEIMRTHSRYAIKILVILYIPIILLLYSCSCVFGGKEVRIEKRNISPYKCY